MEEKNKKMILVILITISMIILFVVGGSFAYFTASVTSNENAIAVTAATFSLDLEDDRSLTKDNLIPSVEEYVDYATTQRVSNGDFIKPYEDPVTGQMVKAGTACIDDNLNDICSIYTFTVINSMTTSDIPLTISLTPSVNTFENLYAKVLDGNKQEIAGSKVQLMDDRYETEMVNGVKRYRKDGNGDWIKKANFDELPISPIILPGISASLTSATKDPQTNEIIPARTTYSVVIWIMETGTNQNESDSNKMFSSKLTVEATGGDGRGITGVISVVGQENP